MGVSQMPSDKVDLSPWLPLFWMHKHLCSQRNGGCGGVALSRSLLVLDVSRSISHMAAELADQPGSRWPVALPRLQSPSIQTSPLCN